MRTDRHPLYHLGGRLFVLWSRGVDAPASPVMTFDEALAAGIDPVQLHVAEARGHTDMGREPVTDLHSLVEFNRAGPRESCLTVAALIRRYRPDGDPDAALHPDEIHPHRTSLSAPGHPDDGAEFWVPWPPGQAPERIDTDTDLHAHVPVAAA
jgi:hypothetical protein